MTRATISVLVLVTASLASCGPSSGEEAHVAVTDSAGVRVVTTIQPEWTDPLPLALPEPVVSVPAEGASSPLSRVLAAEVLADGRIAVLDGLLRYCQKLWIGRDQAAAFRSSVSSRSSCCPSLNWTPA